jgi:hypothetical protein
VRRKGRLNADRTGQDHLNPLYWIHMLEFGHTSLSRTIPSIQRLLKQDCLLYTLLHPYLFPSHSARQLVFE